MALLEELLKTWSERARVMALNPLDSDHAHLVAQDAVVQCAGEFTSSFNLAFVSKGTRGVRSVQLRSALNPLQATPPILP